MKDYERIKHLRKKVLNLSQAEFADKISVSRSNLGSIEIGRINLTDRVVNDICREFSVNENWIREGEEPIFKEQDDPFVQEIVKTYLSLNEDSRKYLKGYMIRLLEEQQND